jgi:hypothetical protein
MVGTEIEPAPRRETILTKGGRWPMKLQALAHDKQALPYEETISIMGFPSEKEQAFASVCMSTVCSNLGNSPDTIQHSRPCSSRPASTFLSLIAEICYSNRRECTVDNTSSLAQIVDSV